ncbi:MAG: type II secretory pathway, component PulD [Verrucomicrobia bacterium]|nr:MAG: type II secretory pathway, component PulD [Verrucomicrobiota bacterium]
MSIRPPRRFAAILASLVIVQSIPIVAPTLQAQSVTETKIELMADALRARDAGDYVAARDKLVELKSITGEDASINRLLDQVNTELAAQAPAKPPPAASGSVSSSVTQTPPPPDPKQLADDEADRQAESMVRARELQRTARSQANRGQISAAIASYDIAVQQLTPNPVTISLINEIRAERDELARMQQPAPSANTQSTPPPSAPTAGYDENRTRKAMLPLGQTSPGFVRDIAELERMILIGRSQYVAGDLRGSEATFKEVETLDPGNAEAKNFLRRIAEQRRRTGWLDKAKTREQLLAEVTQSWQRPGVYEEQDRPGPAEDEQAPLRRKIEGIVIPNVSYSGVGLSSVINGLSQISSEYDSAAGGQRGVNIVLLDPNQTNPVVNLTLRNLSLKRVLDFIVDSVGFQYEIQADAVVVRPGGDLSNLETEFFPVSRSTVIRMVAGGGGAGGGSDADNADPFAPGGGSSPSPSTESKSIRNFLQQAGVNFESVVGSSLVYDGSAMIVTHSSRNLQRIRNILNRYNEVRQVEIEAKFMEVAEGDLEESGIDWLITNTSGSTKQIYKSNFRTLSDTFETSSGIDNSIRIVQGGADVIDPLPLPPPNIPGQIDLGTGATPIGIIGGSIGDFNIAASIRALSRKTGTDLLSAPKVTVLSGNQASITVAQEFRYPARYSEMKSQVGQSGGLTTGGSAGVTITSGTPQDFQVRNVGVELDVTPTVEEDDYSISLDLNPRVTEFDGFVEYGGPSVAISGDTTVTVPPGFYQPIFSVREVTTKVTIWDGATVVMGGLTREEVKTIDDKIPVLGDVPLLGRLFRSQGESSTKRNLLIFVTANLVSPGGSPKKQELKNVLPNSLFQNPTTVTPAGSVDRVR